MKAGKPCMKSHQGSVVAGPCFGAASHTDEEQLHEERPAQDPDGSDAHRRSAERRVLMMKLRIADTS